MKLKIIAVSLFVVVCTQLVFAKGIGTTMFQTLQLPTNAYDAALANTVGAGEVSALSVPSLIPVLSRSLTLTHVVFIEDMRYSVGSINLPIKDKYGLNLSFCYFDSGKIDKTLDSDGLYTYDGDFNVTDKLLNLSYGMRFGQNFLAGLSLKYVSQNIDDVSYSGFAASLSGSYFFSKEIYCNLGASNLGADVKGYSLPTSLYCNFVGPIGENSKGIIQLDDYYNDDIINLKLAMETGFNDTIFFRLGYNMVLSGDYDEMNSNVISNLAFGLGLKFKILFVDYAWLPKGDLGNIHMFTLRVNF